MSKLPRHQDVDPKILDVDRPMGLFWTVTLAAALFIVLSAWVGLVGLAAAGWLDFNIWHYIWVPMLGLSGVLFIPTALMLSKISWSILNMMAMTVEAWAARAGFSIDINRDGYIGYYDMAPPPRIETIEPIAWNTAGGTKLLAKDAPSAIEVDPAAFPQAEDDTPAHRRLIMLPNGVRVPAETIREVVVKLCEAGKVLGRNYWVPKHLDRETFDGVMTLLSRARIVVGRGQGHAGKLAIKDCDRALLSLGNILAPSGNQLASQAKPSQAQPSEPTIRKETK
jgi:hypothetical protein